MPETDELAGLAETAAEIFNITQQDSEDPETDEEPPADEEDDDEVDDLEESEDEDGEDEEDDDPELSDEDDEESDEELEEDEEDEDLEDDEESEDDEEEDEDGEEPLYTVTVQGQQFEVPASELVKGYQRQQDYTLKTQQVADIYQKMSSWYEQRANDPEGWINEIASEQDDPAEVLAGAIRKTGNATVVLGQTLRHLVESGEISEELVEALNLQQVAESAKDQSLALKVNALEQQLQQQQSMTAAQQEQAQIEQVIWDQWGSLGLEFDSPEEEHQALTETLSFAHTHGIPSVIHAYRLMTLDGDQAAPPSPSRKRKSAQKAVAKKKKTAAMSRTPKGGAPKKKVGAESADPIGDATAQALAELGLGE